MNYGRRAIEMLGAASSTVNTLAAQESPATAKKLPPLVTTLAPGVAAGIAGVKLFPEHPVLGFISLDVLGGNAYALYRGKGNDRPRALSYIGIAGAGVVGSLKWKAHPAAGWILGTVLGAVVTSFVPGSTANAVKRKMFGG